MPTLHSFVSARLADLSTAGGLTVRARDMCRTVVSAAVPTRSAPQRGSVRTPRPNGPNYIVIGHDLPLLDPGIERC